MIQFIERHRILFSRIYLLALIAAIVLTHHSWPVDGIVTYIMKTVGFIMVFTGVFGRLWASLYICGSKNRALIDDGPYSMTRNPLYLFSFIGGIGIGLGTESLVITGLILLMFLLIYPATILTEEKRLSGLFGDDYQQYLKDVPRFFPSTKLFKTDEQFEIKIKHFISAIFDSIWFLLIFWGVQTIVQLHTNGVLPVYCKWY